MNRIYLPFAFLLFVSPSFSQDALRLVLQITVDGLRADLLQRYRYHFDTDAHYQHASWEP